MLMILQFPPEAYRRRNYSLITVRLDGAQELNIRGDFLAVLASTADLQRVYVGLNGPADLPLSEIGAGVVSPFERITLRAEPSEVGKTVTLLVGGEAKFTISKQGITLLGDLVGLARESTLTAIKSKTDMLTFDPSNRLIVALDSETLGLARESTLASVRDRLPSSLTALGNLRISVQEDALGLARESTLTAIRDRLPSSLTTLGNFRVSVEESIKLPVNIQDHLVESVVLLPSDVRTTGGVGADVDVGRFTMAEVLLDVTAVSGTNPTLSVYLEGKNQYTGKYKVLWAVENVTSTGEYWLTITHLAFRYLRVRWEISGTSPSFTFSVSMEGKG